MTDSMTESLCLALETRRSRISAIIASCTVPGDGGRGRSDTIVSDCVLCACCGCDRDGDVAALAVFSTGIFWTGEEI